MTSHRHMITQAQTYLLKLSSDSISILDQVVAVVLVVVNKDLAEEEEAEVVDRESLKVKTITNSLVSREMQKMLRLRRVLRKWRSSSIQIRIKKIQKKRKRSFRK